jgi:hypothetical protein
MSSRTSLEKLGTFFFRAFLLVAAMAVVAVFTLPDEMRALRRLAIGVAYFTGLPAALGLVVLAFEKKGWLRDGAGAQERRAKEDEKKA